MSLSMRILWMILRKPTKHQWLMRQGLMAERTGQLMVMSLMRTVTLSKESLAMSLLDLEGQG